MTYDPTDVSNGLIVHARHGDTSPTARLVTELDDMTDALLDNDLEDNEKKVLVGYCRGIVFALTILTCYDEDAVRKQNRIRRQNREEGRESHDRGITVDSVPAAARPRRRRRG